MDAAQTPSASVTALAKIATAAARAVLPATAGYGPSGGAAGGGGVGAAALGRACAGSWRSTKLDRPSAPTEHPGCCRVSSGRGAERRRPIILPPLGERGPSLAQ